MGQLLFVVSRGATKRYEDLKRAFSDQESIEILLDRRVRERRTPPPASDGKPDASDRRRADRRTRPEVDADLKSLGYSVVRLPGPRLESAGGFSSS